MVHFRKVYTALRCVLLWACMVPLLMPASAGEVGASDAVETYFKGYRGVFVMHSTSGKPPYHYNSDLATKELSPCSTFKIFLALVGLESGAIKDESVVEKWDGTKSTIQAWNRDHNLESAMSESVNWYFQRLCSKIGQADLNKYLKMLHYGNEDTSSGLDNFWMSDAGSLRISPLQQVEFLELLYKEKLPVSARSQQIVKRILKIDDGPKGVLFGKTGTDGVDGKMIAGWFVGFVEGKGDTYVFATNIQAANGANGRTAREISTRVLKQLGVW